MPRRPNAAGLSPRAAKDVSDESTVERKGPAYARRRFSELRLGKREGRKEIMSYFASLATSAFNRDVLSRSATTIQRIRALPRTRWTQRTQRINSNAI